MLVKSAAVKTLGFLAGMVSRLLVLYIVLFFLSYTISSIKNINQYMGLPVVLKLNNLIEKPAVTLIRSAMPTEYEGKDYSSWIFISAVILLFLMAETQNMWARVRVRELEIEKDQQINPNISDAAPSTGLIQSAMKGANREKLLELYAEAKKTLEDRTEHLSFLAIDVINSVGMKVGEDPVIAERDFKKYRKLVEETIQEHGFLKASWTPDGAMICFPNTETAIGAGQSLITKLQDFNENTKLIKKDFKIRAGINSGMILYDESMAMEEMASREIDIAGHMQKHAADNSIFISGKAIKSARGKFGFTPVHQKIDGRKVFQWSPSNVRASQ